VQLVLGLRGDEFIIAVNSLWALFNSGLAIAMLLYARSKFFQRRTDFRMFDAVPVCYELRERGAAVRRFAAAVDVTENGMTLVSVGALPQNCDLSIEVMLASGSVKVAGTVVHSKAARAGGDIVARAGVSVRGVSKELDALSRYLHEAAVSRFLGEYSTRYKTYIERHLTHVPRRVVRANRVRASLPAVVRKAEHARSYGVIRDISLSGLLLAAQEELAAGDRVTLEAIIGEDIVSFRGIVVRVVAKGSRRFPGCVAGIQFEHADLSAANRVIGIADAIGTL
jgi:hypothetical protein